MARSAERQFPADNTDFALSFGNGLRRAKLSFL